MFHFMAQTLEDLNLNWVSFKISQNGRERDKQKISSFIDWQKHYIYIHTHLKNPTSYSLSTLYYG